MLMEINGRFWGSLQLAVDAGVDFPRLLIDCAEGRPPARTAAVHRRHPAPLVVGRRGPAAAAPSPLRDRSRAATREPGAARAAGGVHERPAGPATGNEILRLDDPRPFLHESLHWFWADDD